MALFSKGSSDDGRSHSAEQDAFELREQIAMDALRAKYPDFPDLMAEELSARNTRPSVAYPIEVIDQEMNTMHPSHLDIPAERILKAGDRISAYIDERMARAGDAIETSSAVMSNKFNDSQKQQLQTFMNVVSSDVDDLRIQMVDVAIRAAEVNPEIRTPEVTDMLDNLARGNEPLQETLRRNNMQKIDLPMSEFIDAHANKAHAGMLMNAVMTEEFVTHGDIVGKLEDLYIIEHEEPQTDFPTDEGHTDMRLVLGDDMTLERIKQLSHEYSMMREQSTLIIDDVNTIIADLPEASAAFVNQTVSPAMKQLSQSREVRRFDLESTFNSMEQCASTREMSDKIRELGDSFGARTVAEPEPEFPKEYKPLFDKTPSHAGVDISRER